MKVTRSLLGLASGVLALVGISGGCSSGHPLTPSAPLPCVARPSGTLCIHLASHGTTLEDAVGYLSASSWPPVDSPWRLVLTSYSCDPGTSAESSCQPTGSFPGPERRGPPPLSNTCRAPGSPLTVSSPIRCHDMLAQEMATHGDWSGFYDFSQGRPQQFRSPTWFCVSEQVLTAGTWGPPARSPTPARACAKVG